MTIPFLSFFKKKSKAEPVVTEKAALAPEKKSGERMSKTVMPSARAAAPDPMSLSANTYPPTPSAPAPVAQRTVSFGNQPPGSRPSDLPAAVALALEPNVERTISLDLADVVRHMPEGLVRPLENGDASRRILLKASELERGMANGKPAVSIASVYEQAPEIFTRPVTASDVGHVALPFSAVLEQFSNLQTRSDQQRPAVVPQVQTPFLKVTLEDNQKFGIETEPGQVVDLPTVRVEPATAKTIAAAEPEPARTESMAPVAPAAAAKPFSLRAMPSAAAAHGASPTPAAPSANGVAAATPAPTRIPFTLTPTGTDAPASERVPASNGASVPTRFPTPPATPTRIPFEVSPPSDDALPTREPWLTKASFAAEAAAEVAAHPEPPQTGAGGLTISLELRSILELLPPMQLVGDVDEVASGARVEFPFALLEPQLVTGRVAIEPEEFARALPAQYRALFNAEATAAPVSLPLQEVLKNLPAASLRMRDDQEEQEKGANFETPFSAKAAEDAKRLQVASTPVAKPVIAPPAAAPALRVMPPTPPEEAPALEVQVAEPVMQKAAPEPPPQDSGPEVAERTAMQTVPDTNAELDAKTAVAQIGKLEGVKACALMFGDGLSLAGNLPSEYEADGLCAMAPALLQRVENHMVETKLGALQSMTLSCAKAAVTFFMHDNLCLAALHAKGELNAEVRERLGRTVQELSRQYS